MDKIKTNWILVFVLWLAGIVAAMQFAKFSVTFDFLKDQYNVSSFWIGLSLSIVGLIGLIFGVTISIYVSKIGHKNVLLTCLLLGVIISFVQAFNPIFPILFVSRIIEGISHLGIIVTAPVIMVSISSEKHHSLVMGLWSSFFGVAFSLMALIAKPIYETFSFFTIFLVHAILIAMILLPLFFLMRKSIIPHNCENNISFFTAHKNIYSNWRTFSPGILFFFHTFMYIALFTFLPGLSDNENTRNLLLVALPLISIIGTMIAGIVTQYLLSPSKLSVTAYIALIALIITVMLSFGNNTFFIISTFILILFSGIIQGSVFSLIPNISISTDEQTKGNGSVAQLGNLGSTLGSPVFSYFLLFGRNSVIIIVIILSVLGALTGLFITKKISKKLK